MKELKLEKRDKPDPNVIYRDEIAEEWFKDMDFDSLDKATGGFIQIRNDGEFKGLAFYLRPRMDHLKFGIDEVEFIIGKDHTGDTLLVPIKKRG